MFQTYSIKWKPLIISILICLGVGALAGVLTMGSMETYKSLEQPPLAPPSIVFPIVWSILFILMGISAYFVYISRSELKKPALILFAIQLVMNFCWSIIFFNMKLYLFAFVWLVLLWILILIIIIIFYRIKKLSAYLLIPYLLWITFAGYLNLGIYYLNR